MTGKQRKFIDAYIGVANGNATESARIAGYKDPEQAGYENKRKQEILKVLETHYRENLMPADEVLSRLTDHGRGTLKHFVRVDGESVSLDLLSEQAEHHFHLIKKVRTKRRSGVKGEEPWEEIETEIELHDAQAALRDMGRHHKLFTDKVEHDIPDLDSAISREMARLAAESQAGISEPAQSDPESGGDTKA